MKASEIIRSLLDLMDQIDEPVAQETTGSIELVLPANEIPASLPAENPLTVPADVNHFKQIFDILSAKRDKMYSNSPAEVVAGVESVTSNAGGGLNGPKHPADIRADSVSMYPGYQQKPE